MSASIELIRQLRDITGVGMMDAKKALEANEMDIEQAKDWLRVKGLAKAAKKASRVAAEGLVAASISAENDHAVLIEVNCETDFVAQNEHFITLTEKLLQEAANVETLEALQNKMIDGESLETLLASYIARTGEKITFRRLSHIYGPKIISYIHNGINSRVGKIAVVVAYEGENDITAKQIAMHIAASSPVALDAESMGKENLEREKAIIEDQAKQSGKPETVIQKMIEGRMKRFLAENTLLGQDFVINPDLTVEQVTKQESIKIRGFVRYAVGEGIQKKSENFADEVSRLSGN